MEQTRLIAIDPSFTCSGWAVFRLSDSMLIGAGEIKGMPPGPPIAERLAATQVKVTALYNSLNVGPSDLIVAEAATTMRDPRAALLVEQVRGVFEVIARSRGARVPGRVNPRSVQFEVLGLTGIQAARKEVKLAALRVAELLYGPRLLEIGFPAVDARTLSRHQDVIDALLVGNLALTRVRSALATNQALESVFDMVRWRRRSSYSASPVVKSPTKREKVGDSTSKASSNKRAKVARLPNHFDVL